MEKHSPRYLQDTGMLEPVPFTIDRIATTTPEKPFISIPLDDYDLGKGYRDISFGIFAQAVNRCSWWLKQELGQSQSFETLSYSGPQDLRYQILLLASVKTGYNLLLCHPEQKTEDYLSFLQESKCNVFLHSADPLPLTQSILRNTSMKSLVVPPLDDCLKDSTTQAFTYPKSFMEAREEPFALVTSSGSTGVPKLIQLNHGSVAAMARFQKMPPDRPTLFHLWSRLRVLLTAPLSIAVGVFCTLSLNIYLDWTIVLPPTLPLTAELLDSIHKHANVQVSASLPTIYQDLTRNDAYLNNLSRVQYVAYTGGPCSSETGNKLAAKARLTTLYGSSESGPIPTELTDAEDWEYTKFSPSLPHRLALVCEDLYELVIIRDDAKLSTGSNLQHLQPIFCTFPDLADYRTKDLFSKHPSKESVWLYRGRRQDLIELSDTTRSNPRLMFPVPMERAVASHPEIRFALVCGTGQVRPALLVEPIEPCIDSEHESRTVKLIEDVVWPRVQEANKGYPLINHVHRNMIQVTKPGRPMSTTTKGYLSRKATTQLYKADMDSLYNYEESTAR